MTKRLATVLKRHKVSTVGNVTLRRVNGLISDGRNGLSVFLVGSEIPF